ncbi:MAG: tetratricopeptide repeat protein [Methanobacteriota archaeon]
MRAQSEDELPLEIDEPGAVDLNLGREIETMLDREVGFVGGLILKKQCKDLGVQLGDITPNHLKPLAYQISKAITPVTGEDRANKIQQGIIDYMNALKTVNVMEKPRLHGVDSLRAELTIVESKISIGRFEDAELTIRCTCNLIERSAPEVQAELGPRAFRLFARVLSAKKETHEEAFRRYGEALLMAEKSGDRYEQVLALSGIGALAWRTADHKRAQTNYMKALLQINRITAVSKKDKQKLESAKVIVHSGLGNVYLDLVDMNLAVEHNEKALEISMRMENWPEVGRIYNNLARVYEEMRDLEKAIDSYERSVQYCQKGKSQRMEGWTLTNLASALVENGRANEAKIHLERSERILAGFADPIAHSKLNCMWGKYHRARMEWEPGIQRFEKSIAAVADQNSPDYLATAQEEFGTLCLEMGDKDKARELLGAALDWQKKKGDIYRVGKIDAQLKGVEGKKN